MQEQQITLYLYENHTELKVQFTLPDTEDNLDIFIEQKIKWDNKYILNVSSIRYEREKEPDDSMKMIIHHLWCFDD
jgi:hypothetical protein